MPDIRSTPCVCCVFELYKPSVSYFYEGEKLLTTSGLTVLYSSFRNEMISLREAGRYYNVNLYLFKAIPLVRNEMALETLVDLYFVFAIWLPRSSC